MSSVRFSENVAITVYGKMSQFYHSMGWAILDIFLG